MLIQIHILQNYAPSNLNRDDTGAPKDAIFGGLLRGRISSQCLKRSIRKSSTFAQAFEKSNLLAMRTRKLPKLIEDELKTMGVDEASIHIICKRLSEMGRRSSKDVKDSGEENISESQEVVESRVETKQLIFIGRDELRPFAEKLYRLYTNLGKDKFNKQKIEDLEKEMKHELPRSVDIAMFGRMTTSEAFDDVQAAVQVAHALSTNTLTQEFDYFTAVDDFSGQTGAGMIGDVEFNSTTYYKYINVHWEQLLKNLGGDMEIARQAVLALVEAASTAQPSGKQNSFAAYNLPDLILLEVSEKNLPVSYMNAFLSPARAHPSGKPSLMDVSIQQLDSYLSKVVKAYNINAHRAYMSIQDYTIQDAKRSDSLSELLEWLKDLIKG